MRHGFVLPASAALGDWLPLLTTGEAGVRVGQHEIRSAPRTAGWITYGPFRYLEEGRYLISLDIERLADERERPGNRPSAFVEVVAGPELLGVYPLEHLASPTTRHRLTFEVSQNVADGIAALETRIRVPRPIGIALKALTIEPAPASINTGEKIAAALTVSEPAAVSVRDLRVERIGYIRRLFPPGRYEVVVKVERVGCGDPVGQIKITVGGNLLASQRIEFTPRLFGAIRIPRGPVRICTFEVPAGLPRDTLDTEVRIDSTEARAFLIRSIAVKPKTWIRALRDKTYGAAAKMLRAALNKFAVRRS
jgi:hypothetical protein